MPGGGRVKGDGFGLGGGVGAGRGDGWVAVFVRVQDPQLTLDEVVKRGGAVILGVTERRGRAEAGARGGGRGNVAAGVPCQTDPGRTCSVPRAGRHAFDVSRAMRLLNPSPYMYFLDLPPAPGETHRTRIAGASPETMVRLEDGTMTVRLAPIDVPGLETATSISMGWTPGCALPANRSAVCWGDNPGRQHGGGPQMQRRRPVAGPAPPDLRPVPRPPNDHLLSPRTRRVSSRQ